MKTTNLIVEILVVGALAALTLVPFVVGLRQPDLGAIRLLSNSVAEINILVQLSLVYALGVLWNRLGNALFAIPERFIQHRQQFSKSQYQKARMQLGMQSHALNDYLISHRGFIRISRATVILLAAYSAWGLLGNFRQSAQLSQHQKPATAILILLLTLGAFSWWKLYRGYLRALKDAHEFLKTNEGEQR